MYSNVEIIRKNQCKTSDWPGGKTTELYIYPMGSIYSEGDFKWRLSSAKVEVKSSTFTILPGISRLIMVLQGKLFLKHEGHPNTVLREFDQEAFSGEWLTTSIGKVTDFNLMLAKGYNGKLEIISVDAGKDKDITLKHVEKKSEITETFYVVAGAIEINLGPNKKIMLSKGDLAVFNGTYQEISKEFKIHINSKQEAKIIKASILKV